jgi:hypothetical protein
MGKRAILRRYKKIVHVVIAAYIFEGEREARSWHREKSVLVDGLRSWRGNY